MSKFWIAELETRNFSFEAYGNTRGDANRAIKAGVKRHCQHYRVSEPEFWREFRSSLGFRQIQIGAAYRDRSVLDV